ncbi:L-glutamate gamma-semialdehyde dehydrogenase [Bryobacter aggregatus]|uniref:L-glutamate gamma-semialdehyde dehydrogenase n=1 Tax=Bryobacter aggregatus TaxID=360054 RepID=UPI0004E13BDE|nr:L-glutamate gamma-semialdehyde dehydrogenase [Bryobacter aggregatus]
MNYESLPPFANEAYRDFSEPIHRAAMEAALAQARTELGREYDLWIDGRPEKGGPYKLKSYNPSRPAELIGVHQKASAEQANRAIEAAHTYFPTWNAVPPIERVKLLFQAVAILKRRKSEFNAWMVLEAGKSWAEAEADTAEAIDFCDYYARQMLRLATPGPLVQMPGEAGHLVYLGLGVGVIIPPWNFPLAILVGMTVAALVTGNTVVIKPSSETPTIAAKFIEVLQEAGFPPRSYTFLPGAGSEIGDLIVTHPKTRFISFTGSKEVGLRINELAAKTQPGQRWIKRVIAEMGGKDAIIVDREVPDIDAAAAGVISSAFGFQGQKCSACSRVIVDESIYDRFVAKLKPLAEAFPQGPVISASAEKTILNYIEIGKQEGRLITGGAKSTEEGHVIPPTIIADIEATDRIFQEEIFGPVLAVTKARDFDHALQLANDSEYGLTGAVYTSNEEKLEQARRDFFVGNLYLNRKCTGAMVGAHPFGGFNMSGTDSKAGGPDYLLQFLQAKSIAEKQL